MTLFPAMPGRADHECDYDTHPRLPEPEDGWRPPTVGDVVLYRATCLGDSHEALMVLSVSIADLEDANCWSINDEGVRVSVAFRSLGGGVIIPDRPNPDVHLGDATNGVRVVTRQVRFAGSPGWFRDGEG